MSNSEDRRSKDHWHLDKNVTITQIFAIVTTIGAGVWAYADIMGRLDLIAVKMNNISDARVVTIEQEQKYHELRIGTLEVGLQNSLKEIGTELKEIRKSMPRK